MFKFFKPKPPAVPAPLCEDCLYFVAGQIPQCSRPFRTKALVSLKPVSTVQSESAWSQRDTFGDCKPQGLGFVSKEDANGHR